ncbi:hypothetical protein [Agarilytica rhodophyticola]|uniref:hypothetical protein n=1 Tax=Agarilytica rhodophyticola TaxID=1737490 RepID=UPI000B347C43|nr:hypothetical protein [Agarilytica rhodophyticola]
MYLDINTDFKCDANEPSGQSNSKGQAKVKVPNGQKLDGLYIVVHANADKTKVIASNDSNDNTNKIIERAAYTMIAPVFPTKSKVNVTPISVW